MSRVGLFGQISDINDHLFLSGAGVMRPEKLKQKGITCVVNATVEEPTAHLPGIDSVRIRIEDSPFARLDNYFDLVADKIHSTKERGGKTLVHCVAGVSRSASLCIVYLIKYERMSLRQAYHYVKSARPIIRPNLGFWQQMVEFERKLRGHCTVTMIPAEGSQLPFPDVYSQDLRKHILTHPGPPQNDPSIIALQKRLRDREQQREGDRAAARVATLIPVKLIGGAAAANGVNGQILNGTTNGGGASAAMGLGANGRGTAQRRHFGNGLESALRHRHSASALPSRSQSAQQQNGHSSSSGHYAPHHHQQSGGGGTMNGGNSTNSSASSSSALPWRMSSLLSPAPGRRSAFSNGFTKSNGRTENGLFGVPSVFHHHQQSSLFPAF